MSDHFIFPEEKCESLWKHLIINSFAIFDRGSVSSLSSVIKNITKRDRTIHRQGTFSKLFIDIASFSSL